MRRTLFALSILIAVGVVAGCGTEPKRAAPGQGTLGPAARFFDLEHPGRNVSLFSAFNARQNVPRVVLLISPT